MAGSGAIEPAWPDCLGYKSQPSRSRQPVDWGGVKLLGAVSHVAGATFHLASSWCLGHRNCSRRSNGNYRCPSCSGKKGNCLLPFRSGYGMRLYSRCNWLDVRIHSLLYGQSLGRNFSAPMVNNTGRGDRKLENARAAGSSNASVSCSAH